MHVRSLHLRLLAAVLCVTWIVVAIAVVVEYHPGGPVDALVAAAAFLPVLIAAAAIKWPPLSSDRRVALVVVWTGIFSWLLVVPSLVLVLQTLAAGGRQTLLPSPETAYAAALALVTTSIYAGLGLVRARWRPGGSAAGVAGDRVHRAGESAPGAGGSTAGPGGSGAVGASSRVVAGTALGIVMACGVAAAFGGAAIANETALRASLRGASRFGPNDANLPIPPCTDVPREAAYGVVRITAEARLDTSTIGTVSVEGTRAHEAEHWTAQRTTPFAATPLEFIRVGARAWIRPAGSQWTEVSRDVFGPAPDGTLDRAVRAIVALTGQGAAEDLGQDLVGGARSRHCRVAMDGPTALQGFVPLRMLAAADPPQPRMLAEWRGELDYWVFADGQLGMARATVSGYPPPTWPGFGLTGTLVATMIATDRAEPATVEQPLP